MGACLFECSGALLPSGDLDMPPASRFFVESVAGGTAMMGMLSAEKEQSCRE